MAAPLTVAMAERVERSRGPKAGYVVWKGLADVSTSSAVRGPALLGALRCAIQLADVNVVFDLATAWRTSRVTGPAPELFEHCRALAVCAEHVDVLGDRLSAIEADRLRAVFARDVAVTIAPRARAAIEIALRLARAGDDDFASLVESYRLGTATIDELAPLAEAAERGGGAPPYAFALARLALEGESEEGHSAAARFYRAALDGSGISEPPSGGWVGLVDPLARRGFVELAERVARVAAASGDEHARRALAFELTSAAWRLARAGNRKEALERLREARELASPSS